MVKKKLIKNGNYIYIFIFFKLYNIYKMGNVILYYEFKKNI